MGIILLIAGILITADAAAVIIMLGFELGAFASFIIGLALILWGANYKKVKAGKGGLRLFKWIMKITVVYILGMSMFLAVFGAMNDADYAEEYVIVLGSGIKDSQPQPALLERLKTTVEYNNNNPDAKIIVTGGQGMGENVTEASVMKTYLTEHEIAADNIITEENSHNTYENYKLSDEAVGGVLHEARVLTITNGFHVFRAKMYANMCGIRTHTLSAKTKPYLIPVSYIRESAAVIKMLSYYIPKHFV